MLSSFNRIEMSSISSSSSPSSVKEEMEMEMNESISNLYSKLCLDLNMDVETKEDAWNSYIHILKHYVLEGSQLHWLSVSLYVSCRKNKYLLKSTNNPISISRLLKSANNLSLIEFFDKLHKWQDMENLPDSIRNKIDQIENSFNISSIIFQKYTNIFIQIFGGNLKKLSEKNFYFQRIEKQINPKLNQKLKQKKCSHEHLYQLIWTIYALAKTIYPTTSNDLIASFHLLLASFIFVYQICKKDKLDYLLKGDLCNDISINDDNNNNNNNNDDDIIIEKLSKIYSCSSSMIRIIYQEHLKNIIFKKLNKNEILLDDQNSIETIRLINNSYDEIVLTSCIIDERIFLENKNQFNDLLNSLNENRNSKTLQNKTPLTANQHLTFISNQTNTILTPISQSNQLIQILLNITQKQQLTKPTQSIQLIIGQQTFLDDLIEKIKQWEYLFIHNYNLNDNIIISNLNQQQIQQDNSAKYRFDISLKLFYLTLENILIIEKKKFISNNTNQQEVQQTFNKLILNNEFLKSLLGLCLLLILFAHSDKIHDLNWIINIYSLHGYSLLKIIHIFIKTSNEINQSRTFIKYLSTIEETILSSMVFLNDSALWNDIQSKGILSYQYISTIYSKQNQFSPSNSNSNNITQIFNQSPISNHVKRKLFTNQPQNELSIIRSKSDPIVENSIINQRKLSPYTMFYRKLYDLVLSRIDLLTIRLYGNQSNQFEKIIWNLFLYLFENHTELLFRSRDLDQILLSIIYYSANSNVFKNNYNNNKEQLTWTRLFQIYKLMPNAKLKTLRSVFIRKIDQNNIINQQINSNKDPCLTPSKPAGTIHIIDDNMFGDIASFYTEIFLNIPNLEKDIQLNFQEDKLINYPIRNKQNNEQISINIGQNIFIDYSNKNISRNLFSSSLSTEEINSTINSNNNSNKINTLSSSIQAGLNNTVQTTRTRTDDGKFLTTISTLPKFNNTNHFNSNITINQNQNTILFGQSIKRTLSNDSNTDSLNSLTKKVLQIENDRQNIKQ